MRARRRTGEVDEALTPGRVRAIRRRLLDWYAEEATPFPWRTARDPYSALVAAVAAQQTQMSRVLEIHGRWMAAFPTVGALASAGRDEVLRVWGRAGYPRRAVALHEAARRCVELHGGALPRDPEALLALPGVGPFTAAIVRTFGFGDDAAAVDTNVVRVLGRVVLGDVQPARESDARAIASIAERLLPHRESARWNPAVMDFGAKVCVPRPRCNACVLASVCAAWPRFAAGEVAEPVRAQARFAGSDRELRGRLMHVLREADAPYDVDALIEVAARAGEEARARVLLDGLVVDGLAWVRDGRVGLGVGGEERRADPQLRAGFGEGGAAGRDGGA